MTLGACTHNFGKRTEILFFEYFEKQKFYAIFPLDYVCV